VDHGRAGVPDVCCKRSTVADAGATARQALPERSSRSVFQCRGRRRHCTGDVHPRGDRGRIGQCPISAVRDHPKTVSDLLHLPDRVIPVAGLCVGWPAQAGEITPRLSLSTTLIEDRYGERDFAREIDAYDQRRAGLRPYRRQRRPDRWGEAAFYGWSEDKVRQYAEPTRADFGAFVRGKGFCLD
jgi:hypothetical protein